MNVDTDFLKLYRELGMEPGCTLQAFKQAYRRRVRELHPDRVYGGRDNSESLKELNLHYAAALAFHRRHGRLPGTTPESPSRFPPASPRSERTFETRRRPPPSIPYQPPNRWLLLVFSLVAIIPLWALLPNPDTDSPDTPPDASAALDDPAAIVPTSVGLGMDAASVTALLGAPVIDADNEDHWIYGPSWIRFECGEVVDWHSSVLRPLPVADLRSAASTRDKKPARRARRCTTKPRRASRVHPADGIFARRSGIA